MKKIIAALLCLALLLPLCACGQDKEEPEVILEADVKTPFYIKEAVGCPEPDGSFEAAVGAGDSVIACTVNSGGEYRLFRMDTGTRAFTPIDCAVPAAPETLDGLSDGRAALSWRDENGALVVCEIGADNNAVCYTLSLPEEIEDTFIFDLRVVEHGYIFTAYEKSTPCLYLVDRQGTLLKRAARNKFRELCIVRGRDDSLTAALESDEGTVFQIIDGDLTVNAEYSMAAQLRDFISGGGSGEIVGVLPLGKACLIKQETGELRGYCNLADGKIRKRGVVPLSDTELFCIDDGRAAMWRAGDGQERVTLRMQTNFDVNPFDEDTLRSAVNGFNSSNERFSIELADYGVYGEQAEQMLLADLMDGKTPDIFDLNSLNAESCYKNKLLTDLKPYFDADPDINYEDLIPAVRRVTERDGGAYELVPQFTVGTMFAPASVVGEGKFTVESLYALAEEYGVGRLFANSKNGKRLLFEALTLSNDFIDERESRCSFDSPDFIKLLEIAKELPEEETDLDYCSVYYGKALLYRPSIVGVGSIAELNALYRGDERMVGFPSTRGTGTALSPGLRMGMAANSPNKEDVWEFFRYLLSSDYQWDLYRNLPVITDILGKLMETQIYVAEKAGGTSMGMINVDENGVFTNESLKVAPPTEAMKEQLWQVIDSVDSISEYDPVLLEAIMREAARCFAGDCTAEQAAASIQSKASIYISEQYG